MTYSPDNTTERRAVALEQIAKTLDRVVAAVEAIDGELRKTNDHLFQIRHGGLKTTK